MFMKVNYDVYEPEDDSFLLSKYVKKTISKDDNVLEIGIGSGIQSETALNEIKKKNGNGVVVGVDINPNAVDYCKKSKYTLEGYFYESNLFEILKNNKFDFEKKILKKEKSVEKDNKFDLIIFNPPYLPDEKDAEEIKYITTGGKNGYEIIDLFMRDVSKFLKNDGKILLVFSSCTNKEKVNEIIDNYLFKFELLEEKSIFFEKLYCYKIEKREVLKKLEEKGVSSIHYLSKGKRGIVYQGVIDNSYVNVNEKENLKLKNKKCVIKIQSEDTNAINVIDKEVKRTIEANKLGIGPKYYFSNYDKNDKNSFVVREFVDGDLILDWLEKNKHNKEEINKMLINILKQCSILDKNMLEKQEMTKPLKHIIVDDKNNPIQIDFERMRNVEKPSNVTQFMQFLSSGYLSKFISVNRSEIINLSKKYLRDNDINQITKYLNKAIK